MAELLDREARVSYPQRGDRYTHYIFDPFTNPDLAIKARQAHSEGYVSAGLATPKAVGKDGFLVKEIDKSGDYPHATCFMAENPDNPEDRATARLVWPEGNVLANLPTYPLVESGVSSEYSAELDKLICSGYEVGEFCAFAKTNEASHRAVSEIVRAVFFETAGNKKILYCSMVKEVHEAMSSQLSPANFQIIGKPVILDKNQYRRETVLLPVAISPDDFADNIFEAFRNEKDPAKKEAYRRSLMFMVSGVGFGIFSEALSTYLISGKV